MMTDFDEIEGWVLKNIKSLAAQTAIGIVIDDMRQKRRSLAKLKVRLIDENRELNRWRHQLSQEEERINKTIQQKRMASIVGRCADYIL